jgi:hypothetical protein
MVRKILSISTTVIPLMAISLVAWINAAHSGMVPPLPKQARDVATVIGLNQDWNVFAPRPAPMEGWVSMPAVLSDGSTRDVYRDIAPYSQRWGRMIFNITKVSSNPALTESLASFVCRRWNATHEDVQIQTLIIELYEQRIPLPGEPASTLERAVVWSGSCSSTL